MEFAQSVPTLENDGSFGVYVARPSSTPKAAIVVIQEIFGVNAGIREKCDLLAKDGYLAVAPDLFWRFEPGIELDPMSRTRCSRRSTISASSTSTRR